MVSGEEGEELRTGSADLESEGVPKMRWNQFFLWPLIESTLAGKSLVFASLPVCVLELRQLQGFLKRGVAVLRRGMREW